jgi:hypothetical protein
MKKNWSYISIIFIVAGIIIVSYTQVNAQDGVVRYLEERFKEQNINILEITVLEMSPLNLRIVVQSEDDWTTTDDTVVLNAIDRTVFINARSEGFLIVNLVKILQNSEGEQLDLSEKTLDSEQLDQLLALSAFPLILTDEATKALFLERIKPYVDQYNLGDIPIILDVSSANGYQILNLELQTSSLDVADAAAFFFWSLPQFPLFDEINAQGARIVLYRAKIYDMNGASLLDYFYDFQLKSGGWTQDERLTKLGGSPQPSDP